jgi:tripartite-type tricarboxylate transporter receptor subunit TctC
MFKFILAVLLSLTSLAAQAQVQKIIVPGAAGTVTDVVARVYANALGEYYKKPVAVINKPGAAGIPAALYVAQAKDKNTLLLGSTTTLVLNKLTYKTLPYDPDTELLPIYGIGWTTNVIVVNPQTQIKTLGEFIQFIRVKPNSLSMAITSYNNLPHIAMKAFANSVGGSIYFIPYTNNSGGTPVSDVMAGRVDSYMDGFNFVEQHVVNKDLRLIALGSSDGLLRYPNIPSLADVFYGFKASGWLAMVTSSSVPYNQMIQMNKDLESVQLQVYGRLAMLNIVTDTPNFSAAQTTLREEKEAWTLQVTAAGITPE